MDLDGGLNEMKERVRNRLDGAMRGRELPGGGAPGQRDGVALACTLNYRFYPPNVHRS